MQGDIVLFKGFMENIIEGKIETKKLRCWILLADNPENEELLDENDVVNFIDPMKHEIPPAKNYVKGGKYIGKIIITTGKDGMDFGWDTPPLVWVQEGFIPSGYDPRPVTGLLQQPRWGIIYSEKMKIAYVDLGGAFDFREGDLTLSLKSRPDTPAGILGHIRDFLSRF